MPHGGNRIKTLGQVHDGPAQNAPVLKAAVIPPAGSDRESPVPNTQQPVESLMRGLVERSRSLTR